MQGHVGEYLNWTLDGGPFCVATDVCRALSRAIVYVAAQSLPQDPYITGGSTWVAVRRKLTNGNDAGIATDDPEHLGRTNCESLPRSICLWICFTTRASLFYESNISFTAMKEEGKRKKKVPKPISFLSQRIIAREYKVG